LKEHLIKQIQEITTSWVSLCKQIGNIKNSQEHMFGQVQHIMNDQSLEDKVDTAINTKFSEEL